MPRYFTTIGSVNNPKNNLEKDIQRFFENNTHRILETDDELLTLKSDIHKMNVRYNELHKRCKPVTITSQRHKDATHYYFPGGNFYIAQENRNYAKEK